ncbi:MAG: NAD(P)-dependent glycerol-3-phosphate dehydrogenase [Oscillospiraceae bacterium]|nr:NAD(P)-dependent glycerol-3-phosphate dehydrogenase [Oscillospiraceae bacterium]
MEKTKLTIIGNGSWGAALAKMWSLHERSVKTWDIGEDMAAAVEGSEIIVMAIPSHATREVARQLAPICNQNQIIVSAGKGIEEGTYLTLSEVIQQETGATKIAVMSGPSHAEEVERDVPSTNIIASDDKALSEIVQRMLSTSSFRLYASSDRKGVELCGAFKNIIALCSGVSDGLNYGDNTRAALITRGIVEMMRLGAVLGGQQRTFLGLAGMGDAIVTATSKHSRNYSAGLLIGQGVSIEEAVKQVNMVVEGIRATKVAYELAGKHDIECPIINEAYEVIYNGKAPRDAVDALMNRELKWE